jgi:NAD+ synthase (glutamine-hydrolysing)
MDLLGRPRSDVLAYTLPGFATSDATRANAKALIVALGVTGGEIDIRPGRSHPGRRRR